MGFLKNFLQKLTSGFFYVVDLETLMRHLERELKFSLDEKLQASANLNVYVGNQKHHVQIWNFSPSEDPEEAKKGVIFYYDDIEYTSLEHLYTQQLRFLPPRFKIELIDGDDVHLNAYKDAHPELRVEDY